MAAPFSDEQQRAFDEELAKLSARYPAGHAAAALLPALRYCQEVLGHLPAEALEQVATKLKVPTVRAREVASFYAMLHLEPHGHVIDVCTNVSCSLRGAEKVLAYLEQRLGIKAGQTTANKRFTLRQAECLASCGTAPVMQVNEEFVENLTPEKIDEVLSRLS